MRRLLLPILLITVIVFPQLSRAGLDLDQDVITIPDTHNIKPYIWNVQRNPKDYTLYLEYPEAVAGTVTHFKMTVKSSSGADIGNVHVFIADKGLDTYKHLRLSKDGSGAFSFDYIAPWKGEYRFEVVFNSPDGWIDLSRDIEFSGVDAKHEDEEKDAGYGVRMKQYPKQIYAEHVGTLVFHLSHNGEPLIGLEKIDGADMEIAEWDENLKEFVFVASQQNTGGPDVPVSVVFMKPGIHAVFAEFKHNGKTRRIELAIRALKEVPPFNPSVSSEKSVE